MKLTALSYGLLPVEPSTIVIKGRSVGMSTMPPALELARAFNQHIEDTSQ